MARINILGDGGFEAGTDWQYLHASREQLGVPDLQTPFAGLYMARLAATPPIFDGGGNLLIPARTGAITQSFSLVSGREYGIDLMLERGSEHNGLAALFIDPGVGLFSLQFNAPPPWVGWQLWTVGKFVAAGSVGAVQLKLDADAVASQLYVDQFFIFRIEEQIPARPSGSHAIIYVGERKVGQPYRLSGLNLGVVSADSPARPRPGAALESRNFTYLPGGEMTPRRGLGSLVLNPPGAKRIARMGNDIFLNEVWTGGVADSVNFLPHSAEIDDAEGRSLTVSDATASQTMTCALIPALNFADMERQRHINIWLFPVTTQAGFDDWSVELRIGQDAANYFSSNDFSGNRIILGGDYTYDQFGLFRLRMDQFTETGAPSWDGVAYLAILLFRDAAMAAAQSVTVTFDNWHRGPEAINGLHQLRRSPALGSDRFLYCYSEGTIWVADLVNERWTDMAIPLAPTHIGGPRGHFVTYSERAIFVNSVNRGIQLLDGTTWYYVSMSRPTTDPIVADIGAGSIVEADFFFWLFTWYNARTGKESPPKQLRTSPLLTGASNDRQYRITRNEAPGADEGITHWIVYRRYWQSALYRRTGDPAAGDVLLDPVLGSFIPVGTTQITDNIPTASLGLELLTIDHLPMPILGAITSASSFLVGFGVGGAAGIVYWNIPSFPEAWGNNAFQVVGQGDAEPLRAIREMGGRVWAGRDDQWYEGVQAFDGWTFTAREAQGPSSHAGAIRAEDVIIYLSDGGAHLMDGSGRPAKISLLIQKEWDQLTDVGLANSAGVWDKNEQKAYLLTGDGSSPYTNLLLGYSIHPRQRDNFNRPVGAWEFHEIEATAVATYEDDNGRDRPIIAVTGGVVCRLFYGTNDLGRRIAAYHTFHFLDFGAPEVDKVLDVVDIEAGISPQQMDVTLTFLTDMRSQALQVTANQLVGRGGFGNFPLYFGPYGSFVRVFAPKLGKFRRLALSLAMKSGGEQPQFSTVAMYLHPKSGRYKV